MSEEPTQEQEHEPAVDDPPPSADVTVRMLFRVTRTFLVPFLLSWALAYIGGERGMEWLYYAGLGGVGISVIGLLLWLLHQ